MKLAIATFLGSLPGNDLRSLSESANRLDLVEFLPGLD
jgi:hypothetical protein